MRALPHGHKKNYSKDSKDQSNLQRDNGFSSNGSIRLKRSCPPTCGGDMDNGDGHGRLSAPIILDGEGQTDCKLVCEKCPALAR